MGSKARSESISSPKNSIRTGSGGGGREDVHDAAAPRELAAPRDLEDGRVAALEQLAPAARPGRCRVPGSRVRSVVGQVRRGERRLEQRLDARDQDRRGRPCARPPAPPRGPPSRRGPARSARRRARSAAPGPRPATGSPSHAPSSSATRSPISASRATQQMRSPSAASARAAARNDFAPWGTAVRPACRPWSAGAVRGPSRSRSDAKDPVAWSSRGSAARSGHPPPRAARGPLRSPWSRGDPRRSARRSMAAPGPLRVGPPGPAAPPRPRRRRGPGLPRPPSPRPPRAAPPTPGRPSSATLRWRVVRPRYRSPVTRLLPSGTARGARPTVARRPAPAGERPGASRRRPGSGTGPAPAPGPDPRETWDRARRRGRVPAP